MHVRMYGYIPSHLGADAPSGIAVSAEVDHLNHSFIETARRVKAVHGQGEPVQTEGPEVSRRN